ncbi:hypothetical protein KSS87_019388, partial [Heliosperma pusillum]
NNINNINNNSVECSKLQKVTSAANNGDLVVDKFVGTSDDKDFILSQDFFCTPDYITPECQNLFSNLDANKEVNPCPPSPEKLKTTQRKIYKQGSRLLKSSDFRAVLLYFFICLH